MRYSSYKCQAPRELTRDEADTATLEEFVRRMRCEAKPTERAECTRPYMSIAKTFLTT